MIQKKFVQYFHADGFELVKSRTGNRYFDVTLDDGSQDMEAEKILQIENQETINVISRPSIRGLLSPKVVSSKENRTFWEPFYYSIYPVSEKSNIKKKVIDINEFYLYLVKKYEEYKSLRLNLNEIIIQSVSKYGMLSIGSYETKEYRPSSYIDEYGNKSYGLKNPRAIESFQTIELTHEQTRAEYRDWLFIFENLIPSTLEYVPSSSYEMSEEMINFRLRDMLVEFEDIKSNKLNISPNSLMSALILYSRTKSIKKMLYVNCKHCGKTIKQNIGKGRPRQFCSDSHKNMWTKKRREELNKL